MRGTLECVTVAQATAEHPRHGGADMIELRDGSIFMAKMIINRAEGLRHAADDEAPSDVETLRSTDGGRTWGDRRTLVRPGPQDHAAYCPGLVRLRNGTILFRYEIYHRFTYRQAPCISAFACFSRDDCASFSEPVAIWTRSSEKAGSQGDLRQLSTGRIILPMMRLVGYEHQDEGGDHLFAGCYYSDDDGQTWKECESYVDLPMRGAMEPKIEELKDGRLLMVMRTQLGAIFRSYSEDGGLNWSKPQTTGLRAPESCPGLRRIPQTGDLLIVWNHSAYDPKFDHFGVRSPLTVAISRDEGETWEKMKDVETDPVWEFTNPAILVTTSGNVLIAYEASKYESMTGPGHGNVGQIGRVGRSRMHLKLAMFDLDWLYS